MADVVSDQQHIFGQKIPNLQIIFYVACDAIMRLTLEQLPKFLNHEFDYEKIVFQKFKFS